MQKEVLIEWRMIPSYPDYEASCLGKIRRRTHGQGTYPGRLLKLFKVKEYLYVGLSYNGLKSVHSLVCEAFHGFRPEGMRHIRHLDGNKLNNHKDNLKYGTQSENIADAKDHNGWIEGCNNITALFSKEDVIRLRTLCEQSKNSRGNLPRGWITKLSEKEKVNRQTLYHLFSNRSYRNV